MRKDRKKAEKIKSYATRKRSKVERVKVTKMQELKEVQQRLKEEQNFKRKKIEIKRFIREEQAVVRKEQADRQKNSMKK